MGTDTVEQPAPYTAADYDTDMQTIHYYVSAVVEVKQKLAMAYSASLEQVQLVFQTASEAEAKPDIIKVLLKSGLKFLEKAAITAVKDTSGADLGPLVEMVQSIADEVDRAAMASKSRAGAAWILKLRSQIVNAYTQGQTGEDLRIKTEEEYKRTDVDSRGGYIAGVQIELAGLRIVHQRDENGIETSLIPRSEKIEVQMYQSWINQNFGGDCMDGTGIADLRFDADGIFLSAIVNAPLGDRVASRLNTIMSDAGIAEIMDLDIVKKVCRDDQCMCFEGNNVIRKDVLDNDTHIFLTSASTWLLATAFKAA